LKGPPRIVDVAELDFSFEPRPWEFAEARAGDIAQHWAKRKAAQPELFNGPVLLLGRHEFVQGAGGATILRGAFFETDYSAFLAWRDFGFPDTSVCNGFSMAALLSADGAFLLGEMAAQTASAGAIYFPAGTPDRQDVFGDRVDLAASVLRELLEETGIEASETQVDPGWVVVDAPPRIACMKIMRLPINADAAKARVDAFLAADGESELTALHIVRSPADIDEKHCPRFVADFLEHAFRNQRSVG
jgi:8-oxo-dGTP pyrophosphatase MutT (NUDIX family)